MKLPALNRQIVEERNTGHGIDGDTPDRPTFLETGYYAIERGSGNRLALVLSFKPIGGLTIDAITLQLEQLVVERH